MQGSIYETHEAADLFPRNQMTLSGRRNLRRHRPLGAGGGAL